MWCITLILIFISLFINRNIFINSLIIISIVLFFKFKYFIFLGVYVWALSWILIKHLNWIFIEIFNYIKYFYIICFNFIKYYILKSI